MGVVARSDVAGASPSVFRQADQPQEGGWANPGTCAADPAPFWTQPTHPLTHLLPFHPSPHPCSGCTWSGRHPNSWQHAVAKPLTVLFASASVHQDMAAGLAAGSL